MEKRKAKLLVNRRKTGSGGTTFRATLPTAWVREMGLSEYLRELELNFDGEKIIISKGEMKMLEEKQLIERLVKLQLEVGKKLNVKTHGQLDKILTGKYFTVSYGEAIDNLINLATGKDLEDAEKLKKEIMESDLKDLRFGEKTQKKFTEDEEGLALFLLRVKMDLLAGKDLSEYGKEVD